MTERRRITQHVAGERPVRNGRELRLTFRLGDGHPVPAILLLPDAQPALADRGAPRPRGCAQAQNHHRAGPAPAALLLHGYSSHKEEMADGVGRPLLEQGIGSLAIDLPLHGTRSDPVQAQSTRNPLAVMQLWRQAQADAALGIKYLSARREVDRRRIAIVGYSMGAFLSVTLAADEPLIRAVVLAAGGDLPADTPFAAVARMVADPIRAVRRLDGRPLLMVHGKLDRTVKPDQAQRLYDAAPGPKELRWWDAGHRLPRAASDEAAAWLRRQLEVTGT